MKKDLRIDLDDFKRVLSNQTDLVVNEMIEDFWVYDFLTKGIGNDESYPSDHGSYTELSVHVLNLPFPLQQAGRPYLERSQSEHKMTGRGRQSDRETAMVICCNCL